MARGFVMILHKAPKLGGQKIPIRHLKKREISYIHTSHKFAAVKHQPFNTQGVSVFFEVFSMNLKKDT